MRLKKLISLSLLLFSLPLSQIHADDGHAEGREDVFADVPITIRVVDSGGNPISGAILDVQITSLFEHRSALATTNLQGLSVATFPEFHMPVFDLRNMTHAFVQLNDPRFLPVAQTGIVNYDPVNDNALSIEIIAIPAIEIPNIDTNIHLPDLNPIDSLVDSLLPA